LGLAARQASQIEPSSILVKTKLGVVESVMVTRRDLVCVSAGQRALHV
jgi:hypothetical protein